MEWQTVVALAVAIPAVLFPVILIFYMNIRGAHEAVRRAREQKALHEVNSSKKGGRLEVSRAAWDYIDGYLASSKRE